jgi:small subunit ribosomal protein S20
MMKSTIKTAEKNVHQAEGQDQAQESLRRASSVFDKAASKGIVHHRTAARHKSRLAKSVNRMAAAPAEPAKDKK